MNVTKFDESQIMSKEQFPLANQMPVGHLSKCTPDVGYALDFCGLNRKTNWLE